MSYFVNALFYVNAVMLALVPYIIAIIVVCLIPYLFVKVNRVYLSGLLYTARFKFKGGKDDPCAIFKDRDWLAFVGTELTEILKNALECGDDYNRRQSILSFTQSFNQSERMYYQACKMNLDTEFAQLSIFRQFCIFVEFSRCLCYDYEAHVITGTKNQHVSDVNSHFVFRSLWFFFCSISIFPALIAATTVVISSLFFTVPEGNYISDAEKIPVLARNVLSMPMLSYIKGEDFTRKAVYMGKITVMDIQQIESRGSYDAAYKVSIRLYQDFANKLNVPDRDLTFTVYTVNNRGLSDTLKSYDWIMMPMESTIYNGLSHSTGRKMIEVTSDDIAAKLVSLSN